MMKTRIESLMEDLCIQYGFCLPPAEYTRLVSSPPASIDAFTDAVFVAEGLDLQFADTRLRKQVRDRIAAYFETEEADRQQKL